MKKSIKTLLAVILAAAMLFALAGCATDAQETASEESGAASETASETASAEASEASQESADMVTIGVIQYATHPSLDNCYTGFIQGLADEGFVEGENLTVDFQNAQADMANSDLIAKNMVSKKESMIMGIATPAAMSAYAATKSEGIPVVFSAVSDPVAAGIVESVDSTQTNCTGTSDVLNLEAQMQMIRAFLPDATKIGVIYTTSEPNSVSHLEKFKELAPTYGFEIVDVGVTNASEVASAATTVVSKGVDCINNFTDNNVVDNLASVVQAADKAGIPVFGSEVEQVKNGCLASESIDYVSLGVETGKIAARILSGESPSDIPVALISDTTPVYNQEVLDSLGLTLPDGYTDAEAVSAE
jgi:putative ABC transport system substrate-binding protein